MLLVDVNLLVYAVFESSAWHEAAREWLDTTLSGTEPRGFALGSAGGVHPGLHQSPDHERAADA